MRLRKKIQIDVMASIIVVTKQTISTIVTINESIMIIK